MGKIFDVHTHFSIERSAVAEDSKRLGFTVENRSAQEHIDLMDRMGITYSLISCPSLKYLDAREQCIQYCCEVNDKGAAIKKAYPEQIGFAASLPLPYVDEAIREARRAVEQSGAAAICLCSNYEGLYLGDRELDSLYAVIEELEVPILLHPAAPVVYPEQAVTGRVLPMFEFVADTTRTLLDMLASEVLIRYPGVKVVVPHTGSFLPAAIDRFKAVLIAQGKRVQVPLENLYFDLACDAFPNCVPILLNLTDASHIMYGTDYPAIPEFVLKQHMKEINDFFIGDGGLDDVMWNNAAALFQKA